MSRLRTSSDPAAIQGIVKRNVVTITRHTPGWLGEKTTTFPKYLQGQTPAGARDTANIKIDDVPLSYRRTATAAFQLVKKRAPSEREILDQYVIDVGGHK